MPVIRYYPYATPGELNRLGVMDLDPGKGPYVPGTMFGAVPSPTKYPRGWSPKDGKELATFIKDWLSWVEQTEKEMAQLYSSIAWRVMLGVASCDDLHRYNGQAISLYLSQENVRKLLSKAGLTNVPPVPYPRLFADSLIDREVAGVRTIDAKIRCGADGYPTAALQINPARCPPRPTVELGIAPAFVTAPFWGKAVKLIAAGFLALMAGWGISLILRAFPSTARNQMLVDMQKGSQKALVDRSNNINRCIEREIRGLTPAQMADMSLRRKIARACEKQHPLPPKPPELEKPFSFADIGKALLWFAVGAAGVLGVYYGYQRVREREPERRFRGA